MGQLKNAICRAKNGNCDVVELCNGQSSTCPADKFMTSTTTCRAVSGLCDVAETCTGSSANCPANSVASSSIVCRASVGSCDKAEVCGLRRQQQGLPFRRLQVQHLHMPLLCGLCDVAESCNGSNKACPSDAYKSTSTICRAATGECDLTESCIGTTANCPTNFYLPNGASCMSGSGTCQGGNCLLIPDGGLPDAGLDGGNDGSHDGATDSVSSFDGTVEAGSDAAADAEHDAASEAGVDAASEAGGDAASDASWDNSTIKDNSLRIDRANVDSGVPVATNDGCNCQMGGEQSTPFWLALPVLLVLYRRKEG